jgi:hypothetical protein
VASLPNDPTTLFWETGPVPWGKPSGVDPDVQHQGPGAMLKGAADSLGGGSETPVEAGDDPLDTLM